MSYSQDRPVKFAGKVFVRELSLSNDNDRKIIALLDGIDPDKELGDFEVNLFDLTPILIRFVP